MKTLLLLAAGAGLAAWMVNRLYVLAVEQAITVRGQRFALTSDPVQFWLLVAAALFGLLSGVSLCCAALGTLWIGNVD